jgi:hypothetical protein
MKNVWMVQRPKEELYADRWVIFDDEQKALTFAQSKGFPYKKLSQTIGMLVMYACGDVDIGVVKLEVQS